MFGLAHWNIGDPLSTQHEAIDAASLRNDAALDEALAGLTATELSDLAADADRLAERCRAVAGGRS
jgi:hypothetical protein